MQKIFLKILLVFTRDCRIFWSSVLFTKLVVISLSILQIAPRTFPIQKKQSHWDYSSVGSLTRNLTECYFVFFYLCIDKTLDEDEWLTRLHLIQLRDHVSRSQMFKAFQSDDFEKNESEINHYEDLNKKLLSRKFFRSLPENRQKELLKGEKALLLNRDELLERMGEDKVYFRGMWKYLSSHTHSMPISFYRMADDGRGCGVENPVDKAMTTLFLDMTNKLLNRAILEMLVIFPNGEQPISNRKKI